ncbi:MAG: rhomboid family intramembrane serine protease [Lentisphaerae bacterium]|nr:rhomboid family intramembrane serine protease [Lentisphaerota bacterium]
MRDRSIHEMKSPRFPIATKGILIATAALFIVHYYFLNDEMQSMVTYFFSMRRDGLRSYFLWQPLTYMFLHGGLLHLIFNMLVVFVFGKELERILGPRRFLLLYLGSGIMGGLGWALLSGTGYCIGASGGAMGLLGMYAALFPNRPITLLLLFIFPVTLRARTLALIFAVGSFVLTFWGSRVWGGNVAHSAHLVGLLAGAGYGYQLLHRARRGRDGHLKRSLGDVVGGALRMARGRPHLKMERGGLWESESEPEATPERIDQILDKILARGVGSLNAEERRVLERASADLND